ncbi:GspH/FimT family pseudopilin [Modicisalibacter zincidurans]|uniref:GspH/FimT family pseudopilin n=1 Tax=Halomonadaceae TaxID=28256 RepID=UPI000A046FAC|nr:GspH/FimT family pseudopilin [Halomonas sp. IOP_31]
MHLIRQRGFTLIELMVTLTILVITLGWVAPSFSQLISRNSIVTDLSRLRSAIALARNTAITREQVITLCPSRDQKSCNKNWSLPLLVIQGPFDGNNISQDTDILKIIPEGNVSNTRFRNDYRWIRIPATGWPRGYNGTFELCDTNGESASLVMSNTGRLRSGDTAQCKR